MAGASSIEWTDATWNPVRGCSRISAGCANCYAEKIAARFSQPAGRAQWGRGFAILDDRGARWTGKVELVPELLDWPARRRVPRRIFVNSTSDLFHEALPDDDVFRVFDAMAAAPHHTFQVLTKRAGRMAELMPRIRHALVDRLEHVWLGVSVEDQEAADERIPHLLATPAAVRFLSCEPLLGEVHLEESFPATTEGIPMRELLHWVIAGGESGAGARPMAARWVDELRDECLAARVPFFMKQLGSVLGGRDHKNIDTFPADLQVREFPRA